MLSTGCPGRAELLEFSVGNLPRPAFVRIAEHIERCAGCVYALEALDNQTDSLLARLRQPAYGEDLPPVEVPPALLAAARAARARRNSSDQPAANGPRRLDRFELLEELGAGSFGQVFRAHDSELDRPVAVKVLRAGRLAGQEEIDRLVREAR